MDIFEFLRRIFFFGGYLAGSKAFPKPLSAAEERRCIERLEQGDGEARDTLIEHNLRLVAHIAKKYASSGGEMDDYISIGTIGLIKGVDTFDRSKGSQLVTYISRCIENEVLMFLRSEKKRAGEMHLIDSIGEDKDGNALSLMDILCTRQDDVEEQVNTKLQWEKVCEIIGDTLNAREQSVINMRYGLAGEKILPQREIAKRLGISRSYISRIEKKALLKLQKALQKGI